MTLIVDIETAPLPAEQLATIKPVFDETTVACGNLKDPEKIAAKLKQAEIDWTENAALHAVTGRVLAIGYLSHKESQVSISHGENEVALLQKFWQRWEETRKDCSHLIGHNILEFDLPFLVRRSWIQNVDVPETLRNGRYFSSQIIDTRHEWLMGSYQTPSSLDTLSKAIGRSGKPAGITGKDFARLYYGTVLERVQAMDYLKNDLLDTAALAERMGLIY